MDCFYFLFFKREIEVQLIDHEKLLGTSRETSGCNAQWSEKCQKLERAQGGLAGSHEQVRGSHVKDDHVGKGALPTLGELNSQGQQCRGDCIGLKYVKANGI